MVGLGAVWCFAANKSILPFLGPIRALIAGCMMASFALLGFALEKEWAGLLSGLLVGFGYAITAPAEVEFGEKRQTLGYAFFSKNGWCAGGRSTRRDYWGKHRGKF